ncbi:hypothetical protein Ocin01_14379 [Orchesella cincta]|uniref:DUF659 domain-containing protein n=1 Tax=Orchesella cincta TaxID=48709 RepID=A0A1D2MH54_ORCCI|nr:hypothetical protein Ocin01_14379 [Orchesella cincta]
MRENNHLTEATEKVHSANHETGEETPTDQCTSHKEKVTTTPVSDPNEQRVQAAETVNENANSSPETSQLGFEEFSSTVSKMSEKIGRKRDGIWDSFVKKRNGNGKVISNNCIRCGKEVSAKACRMSAHVAHCKSKSKPAGKSLQAQLTHSSSTNAVQKSFPTGPHTSFRQVENPFFKDLIKDKVPGYTAPSAKRLRTTILNQVYQECMLEIRDSLKDRKVVIIQDGWSTNQNAPVVSHCLHTGTKAVFFDAVATECNKKDANYCYKLLDDAIAKAEADFSCVVVGVVTDNCSVMKALKRVTNIERPELFVYGCNAHIFNLLGQDLSNEQLIEKVVSVQNIFETIILRAQL